MSAMTIINSSAYRFMQLPPTQLVDLQAKLQDTAAAFSLKGTILLSPEGINIAVSGTLDGINQFKDYIEGCFPGIGTLSYNDTYSSHQPFRHLFVKIKKQIIPYDDGHIPPAEGTAPYITPKTLFHWLHTQRDITLLDARNQYEVEAGTFQQTVSLNLECFRDFPHQSAQLPALLKQKTVVTFCTGGIRCEKAANTLLKQGFQEVYQLQGGILNYFKACGRQYYQGGCFVFDARNVIDASCTQPNH
jgi:UPF0176 protein